MKTTTIVIIIGIVLIVGIAFYVFLMPEREIVIPLPPEEEATIKDETPPLMAEETVIDCLDFDDEEERGFCLQNVLDIFTNNLEECRPSIGSTFIGWEGMLGIFRKYEIKGIENDKCIVQFEVGFVDPMTMELLDWDRMKQEIAREFGTEKEEVEAIIKPLFTEQMICEYGPEERTIEYVGELEGCYGPLFESLDNYMNWIEGMM